MATLSATNPTLLDHAKALDPDGSIAVVAELLSQTNEILEDMSFVEGNLPTGHRMAIRTGIPTGTWRRLYGGVQPEKTTREQITESVGMLEAYNEVDVEVADLNGNNNEFRMSEARGTIEGMNQNLAQTIIYGNTANYPERFDGLQVRYNDLSANNADNIIDGGGSGSTLRSIWLVVWGPETVFGLLPKASSAGLKVNDFGEVTIESGSGSRYQAYRTHFQLKAGLALKDWRYVVRIANIDKTDNSLDLPDLMFDALARIPTLSMGRPAFYMGRDVLTLFRKQLAEKTSSSTLQVENVGGVITSMWNGVPLRLVDQLMTDESQIT